MIASTPRVNVRGRLRRDMPLAPYTSWRVGGPADQVFEPLDREDLLAYLAVRSAETPLLWIGLGSNLLVRDGGFRGTAIVLRGALNKLSQDNETTVHAEAGVHCARLSKFAERQQCGGLGFMAGIPGTVGGALAMNAGAWGGETWDCVVEAEIVETGGRATWLTPEHFDFGYRTVVTPPHFCGFLGARLRVTPDDGTHVIATRHWLSQRRERQPVGKPSAGSTFRNPPNEHAARLIERCGLKGRRVGGAVVSRQHANFIINEGNASAADVEELIKVVQAKVEAETGIRLEPEVRIIGEALHA